MPEPLSYDRYLRLIADEKNPYTHRLLWVLLGDGELRLNELLSLDVRDVDLETSTAFVEYPKAGTPKAVPLSPNARLMLQFAINYRTEGPLFIDDAGAPISRDAAIAQARKAGVSIHDFRLAGQRERAGRASS
ncbi:tyrosine-type recombinase/integrase [Streptomyces sp. NPDC006173]|uniref:tyrosine-type recombinase/integrase n=1 Tax=Streptomyces sp. NPDC006173 TaxID=3155349 RepID=UPI0034025F72